MFILFFFFYYFNFVVQVISLHKRNKKLLFYFGWDLWDHQLTGSMTSTFLTVWSGATAGQSDSSWYPVALLLRL